MKADTTQSRELTFGTKANTYKDIGVDLCAKKKGWGWAVASWSDKGFYAWCCLHQAHAWSWLIRILLILSSLYQCITSISNTMKSSVVSFSRGRNSPDCSAPWQKNKGTLNKKIRIKPSMEGRRWSPTKHSQRPTRYIFHRPNLNNTNRPIKGSPVCRVGIRGSLEGSTLISKRLKLVWERSQEK